jgi:hypothetical protein
VDPTPKQGLKTGVSGTELEISRENDPKTNLE